MNILSKMKGSVPKNPGLGKIVHGLNNNHYQLNLQSWFTLVQLSLHSEIKYKSKELTEIIWYF